ncbi:MAG: hypothetical protein Q8R28_22145, partial [Dehalococcoidia bacterium]|nr:hypothetical protein [Dehalococcoidia bacterium]
ERDYTCTPAQVHQAHFRYVPEAAGPGRYIHAKPGKGVFPVTFVHYGDVRFVTDECGICEKCHSGTIPCVEQSGGDQLT